MSSTYSSDLTTTSVTATRSSEASEDEDSEELGEVLKH